MAIGAQQLGDDGLLVVEESLHCLPGSWVGEHPCGGVFSLRRFLSPPSVSVWASRPSASFRLTIDSSSILRPRPTRWATTAWPDSCVAMVSRSSGGYSVG